ncbi:relaxase/mobilization nuclease-like protein [Mucilaginibacter gracilis]|uniref:Relaxase/mobilization nuclease-like protein n=1 Tax=Mucilaginibacter gracilis TaxID=423350 RepID=A0A495J056_9SPHI|nr:relaxase/mobilization nuclease domain-containing protein [Mucilaginibacter gracilis]RKR82153.1 relaxase/mobilization nuclease-like protein [Mucilaginibacter gracilis]
MVAVVHTHKSLRDCLNYNERKVQTGLAVCLEAGFYPMDAADMNFHQKLRRLELLTELNQRTKVNTLHVSLNFHPSEKPSEDLLKEIAEVYLEKIGFGGQPYLLYQHFDARHPHIHLLTTNIKADGSAINMHNIGRNQSKQARQEIELRYGLVQAGNAEQDAVLRFKPVNVGRALYGRMETKKAMNGIINVVTDQYRFSSLAQFNAVLGLYNLVADTGSEGSRVNRHKGLVFRMLDEQGNKVGVPIKASDFASKPTLKNLQVRFAKNESLKLERKARVANAVNMALLNGAVSLEVLKERLREKGIDLVIRQNAEGLIYGLTYVDHQQKIVFNGSELGKAFSAKAILERCNNVVAGEGKKQNGERVKRVRQAGRAKTGETREFIPDFGRAAGLDGDVSRFAEALLVDGDTAGGMDQELKRTRRKKKKRLRISPG